MSTRSGRASPIRVGTAVRAPTASISIDERRASAPSTRSYRPTATRWDRSVGWEAAASCRTSKEVKRPSESVVYDGRSVFTPAASSHSRDQAVRSRPEVASSADSRSASPALPHEWAAK